MLTLNKKDQFVTELMIKIESHKIHYELSEIEIMSIKLSILDASENCNDIDDLKDHLLNIFDDNLFIKSLI